MRLRRIGFWNSKDGSRNTGWPDPRDFVDPSWDEDERRLIFDYLKCARRVRFQMGYSRCRLCGVKVGTGHGTDGIYLWPEGLAHYVWEHGVRPPREFVEHALREIDAIDEAELDDSWWQSEPPTGTARHWTRWIVEPTSGESGSQPRRASAFVIGQEETLEAAERELVEAGRIAFALRWDAETMRDRLLARGVACVVLEEHVPVPDSLLA